MYYALIKGFAGTNGLLDSSIQSRQLHLQFMNVAFVKAGNQPCNGEQI